MNTLLPVWIFLCLFIYLFICPAEPCRFQITSTHGTGHVTFWCQVFMRMGKTSRWIVPGLTSEMATLFSLECLVLGSYESKKVFWRNNINLDQTNMLPEFISLKRLIKGHLTSYNKFRQVFTFHFPSFELIKNLTEIKWHKLHGGTASIKLIAGYSYLRVMSLIWFNAKWIRIY